MEAFLFASCFCASCAKTLPLLSVRMGMLFTLFPLGGESERARRAVPVAALLVKPTCAHCAARHRAGVRSVGALAGGFTIS